MKPSAFFSWFFPVVLGVGLIFLLILPICGGEIAGTVISVETKTPIGGTLLYLDSLPQIRGISDLAGNYALKGVPDGKFHLMTAAPGFESDFAMNVEAGENSASLVDFELRRVEVFQAKVVVILVDFPDVKFAPNYDASYFRKLLFDAEPGARSLRNYFYAFSKGRLDVTEGAFTPVLTAPMRMAQYADHRSELVKFAITASFKHVNYRKFDLNDNWKLKGGPDRKVDHVMIIHAGDCGAITMRKTDIVSGYAYKTFYYPPGQSDFKIDDHVLVAESCPLGSFCHEFLHSMAAQDLYCAPGANGKRPLKTSQWSLMDVGMYNPLENIFSPQGHLNSPFPDKFGFHPSYPDPWTILYKLFRNQPSRMNLPILSSEECVRLKPDSETILALFPFQAGGKKLKVASFALDERRFFLVSVRQKIGFDRGLRDKGVVVWFCDNGKMGQMSLAGPVEVMDAHPNSPKPSVPHLSPDYELDDAAFDVGEGEIPNFQSSDRRFAMQVLKERSDGSYDIRFVTGASQREVAEVITLPDTPYRFSPPFIPLLCPSGIETQGSAPGSLGENLSRTFGIPPLGREYLATLENALDNGDYSGVDEFLSTLVGREKPAKLVSFRPLIDSLAERLRFNLAHGNSRDGDSAREISERLAILDSCLERIDGRESGD